MFGLYVYMYTICLPGVLGGQKMVSDTLELELTGGLSHNVGVGNQTWVLC